MAEAVLEVALGNLNSLIQKELGLFLGVDRELERLSSILTTIRAVLEDAEEKQLTNNALKDWLLKLKDAAYVLDDILDECATEALRLEYQGLNCGSAHKVGGSCLSSFHPNHALFRYKIAKKMKRIRERLDEIADEKNKFHLRETVTERRTEVMEWRQTTSTIAEPQVYGREKDREDIVRFLVNHASGCDDISVYTIIGIGGLGKTTLAQYVFNDERIREHFELKFWVCVSEDFSLKRILKAIINLASEQVREDLDLELLKKKLQEVFQGKRYLLVLDDVWNENQEKWNKLKYMLACGSKGASILVTTRLAMVASIMGTIRPHQLSMLSEEHCWELFRQRAFGEDRGEDAELVAIGKEIVKKCKRVPLAAKALGSLLRFKSEEKDWLNVKESEIWSLPQDEGSILPALRLSYLNLPAKIRQCFAYCAFFPKDEEMSKEHVIELWMSNGFISSNGRLEVEDVGDKVWNELCWRSFFQNIKEDSSGTRFKMHDLVHDLAQSVIEEECSSTTIENDMSNLSKRTRHISFNVNSSLSPVRILVLGKVRRVGFKTHPNAITVASLKKNIRLAFGCVLNTARGAVLKTQQRILSPLSHLSSQLHQVKTLIIPFPSLCPKELSHVRDIWMKFDSLRVLEICCLHEISSSIGHFKHLRYLNLSCGLFKTLPNSITRLWNLQILNLNYCRDLQMLPDRLKCLKFLRHLHLEECNSLSRLAPEIGQLNFLRTLNIYIVGKQRGFHLAELRRLNLNGKLHIKHLERVRSVSDAKEANMASKHLNQLFLSWERNEESQLQENVEQILEALQPHTQKLQTLCVRGYMGVHYPQWMGSPSFKDLYEIELVDCENCLCLPALGHLPSLKSLKLDDMKHVQYVDDDESSNGGVAKGFKALKFLELRLLPSLIRLSKEDGENMFPCLFKLEITDCPELSLPCLPSIIELRIEGQHKQALLGSIQNLPSLKTLQLYNMNHVQYVDDGESYNDGVAKGFKGLEFLVLEKLPSLIRLSKQDGENMFPCLSKLDITDCPKLSLRCLPSIIKLRIAGQHKQALLGSIQNLQSLESLKFCDDEELTFFPDGMLYGVTRLKKLHIRGHRNLELLPTELNNLNALEELRFEWCYRLEPLTERVLQGLTSLKRLTIQGYSKFKLSAGFQYLTSLEDLTIAWCQLEDFPEDLQHLTTLQSLYLEGLPNLVSLPSWLGNLRSLQSLRIYNCPKLTSLPMSIQCLASLKVLRISLCPELVKRCEKERGEDWRKIAHVPRIDLGPF